MKEEAAAGIKPPHLSGRGLLSYLKEQKVNINIIGYPGVQVGPKDDVKMKVADILIDDEQGVFARQFADRCSEYERAETHRNTPLLISQFQKFVRDIVLLSQKLSPRQKEKETDKNDKSKSPGEKIEEIYGKMEHSLDRWSEMYETLITLLREYLNYLSEEYKNPDPESWQRDTDEDEDEGGVITADKEYIPNRYLDILVRAIDTLEAKAEIIDLKIERGTLQSHEYQQCRDTLDQILELAISIKKLGWSSFESYPFENEIIGNLNGLIHFINKIFHELK